MLGGRSEAGKGRGGGMREEERRGGKATKFILRCFGK